VVHGCCTSQTPPYGAAINAKDQILIEYTKDPGPGGMWTQTLWNLSQGKKQLFSYAKGNAPAKWYNYFISYSLLAIDIFRRFQIATELQAGNTGTADIQHYWNISLRLKTADPDLGAKFQRTGNIDSDRPTTVDGGKTWTIKHVQIPPMRDEKALVSPN
jgi:hypothetical protein